MMRPELRFRKRCKKRGHKWYMPNELASLPFQFCKRFYCDGSRVNPELPKDYRQELQNWLEEEGLT